MTTKPDTTPDIGLSREQFVHRLICAGWDMHEAEREADGIYDEPEEDWEGQL
ncbi:MAG TPA: hypothetical protein VN861_02865 [Candidatus Acidoferrales bacterium]|nr:hypothetical protein [Candidatus Acidoferrales bacterium]